MARTMSVGTLWVVVLAYATFSAPPPAHALLCCDNGGYQTQMYWYMASTCADAQAQYRAAALPEAQAACGGATNVCAFTLPPCYQSGNQWVVDGMATYGCKEECGCIDPSANLTLKSVQVRDDAFEAFEKVQRWTQTFESLAKAEGLTEQQRAVLQAASKLGTASYFEAKVGTADWQIQVQAPSNAILEAAAETLPADLYAAVWSRFQLAPGASQVTALLPVCNCKPLGTNNCTAGGVLGSCRATPCVTCGGSLVGVCSL